MKKRAPKSFATEVELCAAFLDCVKRIGGWTAYAETAGHDILLVRDSDGYQLGIQAKLRIGTDVINQASDKGYWDVARPGPNFRAVLVPESTHGFGQICAHIGLTIIVMRGSVLGQRPQFSPRLPSLKTSSWESEWHEWSPDKRHPLPEYVPDVAAGSSAPIQLTQWKIAAIKIMITLEKRGFVTRQDFKVHKIDHRRWLSAGSRWLVNHDGVFVAGPYSPGDFRSQHPRVYAEIEADAEIWMPKIEHTAPLPLSPIQTLNFDL